MTNTIEQLAEAYAQVEERMHRLIAGLSARHCSVCRTPCCKPMHCSSLLSSPWLRLVAAQRGVKIDKTCEEVHFLGEAGCTLPAGRPIQCTAYVCPELEWLITDPLERFVYQVLTGIPAAVVRCIAREYDLTEVADLSCLTKPQRKKLMTTLSRMRQCLERSERLLKQKNDHASSWNLTDDLLYLARAFPFAAKTVRFKGEPPRSGRLQPPRQVPSAPPRT